MGRPRFDQRLMERQDVLRGAEFKTVLPRVPRAGHHHLPAQEKPLGHVVLLHFDGVGQELFNIAAARGPCKARAAAWGCSASCRLGAEVGLKPRPVRRGPEKRWRSPNNGRFPTGKCRGRPPHAAVFPTRSA